MVIYKPSQPDSYRNWLHQPSSQTNDVVSIIMTFFYQMRKHRYKTTPPPSENDQSQTQTQNYPVNCILTIRCCSTQLVVADNRFQHIRTVCGLINDNIAVVVAQRHCGQHVITKFRTIYTVAGVCLCNFRSWTNRVLVECNVRCSHCVVCCTVSGTDNLT